MTLLERQNNSFSGLPDFDRAHCDSDHPVQHGLREDDLDLDASPLENLSTECANTIVALNSDIVGDNGPHSLIPLISLNIDFPGGNCVLNPFSGQSLVRNRTQATARRIKKRARDAVIFSHQTQKPHLPLIEFRASNSRANIRIRTSAWPAPP